MQELALSIADPWMVIGEFNEIISHHEKIGKKVTVKLSSSFQDCLSFCHLEDLKFSEAVFLPEGLFDHSPVLVHFYLEFAPEKKPFRYFRMWKEAPSYAAKIQTSWNIPVVGTEMFQVVSKLKRLKQVLSGINREGFSDIQQTKFKAKFLLRELQEKLQKDPLNDCIINQEQVARENFLHFHKAYMMFLAQKAKVIWLASGDENTHIFHASLKARRIQNRILSIKNECGIWVDTPDGMKAPGPDGYSSYFYQDNWNLVGLEVSAAVLSFLKSGKLLKEINATTITLIPKTICPYNVCDFRPIACCNVIYKAASKMICSRLRQVLPDLLAENQGGFVHGRYIAYNIMICQDLVRHYGRKNCKPCCMIKLDLRKAYDTIEWDFIEEMLIAFHFPLKFIQLIMICVQTPRYSLMINGSMHGFFASKRGLRQGDPMSPVLFVLGMEYLSKIMLKVGSSSGYKFHGRGLKLFSKTSGLIPNETKFAIYCSGMPETEIVRVLDVSGFTRSTLSFRYLGIPICSKHISSAECGVILEKMLLRDIEAICRAFLWKGLAESQGPGLVAWNSVCTPKAAGGLGFRKISEWNFASLGKYVWAIASKKDNLWVKWIHSIYLKKEDWWEYSVQPNCSWYWKKIVAIKHLFKVKLDKASFIAMKYSIQSRYDLLHHQHINVQWSKFVWERSSIPKHRFILWLVMLQKLSTRSYIS
ncbi:uncharacterized protein LOC133832476 [Humulus lupulus]|uniref:uncharacterized protein LOC133832476 n=1 Tax=Humulus lupulus TaxID=3486 RepID=UPI002B415D43|nr:uncharacterized protein LOC133832476 [Humulus lupulus]